MHKVNFLGLLPPEKYHAVSMAMRKSKKQGFSLVEVVLALAVVAFAFVAILGLIPAGMSSFRQAINISVCSQIGQRVIADAFQGDYDTLLTAPGATGPPASPTTNSFNKLYRYFDEEGNEIISTTNDSKAVTNTAPGNFVYLAITRITPNLYLPGATKLSPTANLVVQVVYDPSEYLPQSSEFTNGLLSTTKIPPGNVLTYYAQITRN